MTLQDSACAWLSHTRHTLQAQPDSPAKISLLTTLADPQAREDIYIAAVGIRLGIPARTEDPRAYLATAMARDLFMEPPA